MDFLLKILLWPKSFAIDEWGERGALFGEFIETDFDEVGFSFSSIVVSRGGAIEDILKRGEGKKENAFVAVDHKYLFDLAVKYNEIYRLGDSM